MTRHRASAPGKLMIAGEYSVLSPGGGAVAMAVGRRLEVTVEPAQETRVTSAALGLVACPLEADPRLAFVAEGLRAVRALSGGGPLSVDVRGDAGQVDGRGVKLGLGSSAAVTVATVAAALAERGWQTSPDLVFRLAALAHARAQGRAGSGYDVATQVLGGLVLYRPPAAGRLTGSAEMAAGRLASAFGRLDPPQPLRHVEDMPRVSSGRFAAKPNAIPPAQLSADPVSDIADPMLPAVVCEEWPEVTLTRVPWPVGLGFAACWVGTGAATARMMSRTDGARQRAPRRWESLLGGMRASADEVARALRAGETGAVLEALVVAEGALRSWDDELELGVVTAPVRRAVDLANEAGCVGRTSGAGGGDCVLAFAVDPERLDVARAAWTRAGLTPIDLALDEMGTVVSKMEGKEDQSAS